MATLTDNRFGPGSSRWEPRPETMGARVPEGPHPRGCLCKEVCIPRRGGLTWAAPLPRRTDREGR